ncbi:cyclic nucleotide-binding domain-containing protein [Motilimonas cestriensis]|uniref:histidine kinase n=1 Tax=Motilimonas cestriensis TaxID=2742685 RepID=A0ABS8WD02_9GAMM|nr:ATP-binding protein [Motilimonas cestriensis]MCE2595429.1 cyclic nucleotide-binding domain-containing protein [Motilimonas cestriensis]
MFSDPSPEIAATISRLQRCYFNQPERQLWLKQGEVLLEQGQVNEKLFLLLSGQLTAYYQVEPNGEFFELNHFNPPSFTGVHSYFSGSYCARFRVVASEDCVLAYIDTQVEVKQEAEFGPLAQQFMPVIVNELSQRQILAMHAQVEHNLAQQRAMQAEKMSTIGQLASGLSHELNNALGAISGKSAYFERFMDQHFEQYFPTQHHYFRAGLDSKQGLDSKLVRSRGKIFEQALGVERDQGKALARIFAHPDEVTALGKGFLKRLDEYADYWQLGRDFKELKQAVNHATGIIKSVRLLGADDTERKYGVDINDTINCALDLMSSHCRSVDIRIQAGQLPLLCASHAEWVQVWVNLIKNAYEALLSQPNPAPLIRIKTQLSGGFVQVSIEDNGPGIAPNLMQSIFQPDMTTKKGGLSFGLGLGLSISQRIISSYQGELKVVSQPGLTCFSVFLPIEVNNGNN